MKPLIHIDDTQIHIDDEHYTLFIRFKQQPLNNQVNNTGKYPNEIIAIRGNEPPVHKHIEKNLEKKKCLMCDTVFNPSRVDKIFCSKKCKSAHRNNKHRSTNPTVSPLKGQPALTGIKVCAYCKNEYKPTSNVQKYCTPECKRAFLVEQAKPIIKTETPKPAIKQKLSNPKAAQYDKKVLAQEKKLQKLLQNSPKTDDLIPVFIDAKTTIYIKPGEDVDEARKNFIEKHNQFEKGDS
jgi:hypothetical protein